MAPTKNLKRKQDVFVKESFLFKYVKKGIPDPTFVSLHNCKRNFGFSFTDLTLSEVKEVVWGVRCGQQGYFVPPEVKPNRDLFETCFGVVRDLLSTC